VARWSTQVLTATLGVAISLAWAAGCDRSAEASRAVVAARRASWAREIGGMREQQAALAARLSEQGTGSNAGPAALRTRAVLDGARQSIADVERQLAQADGRMEQAIRRGGEAGQHSIDDESANARGYLTALGEQLAAAARQLDGFSRSEAEASSSHLENRGGRK
jgi:hypothetical protein